MNNKTMKELAGTVNAINYIESLEESTRVISHTVTNDGMHYIITEHTTAQVLNHSLYTQVLEWCQEANVVFTPYTKTFTTTNKLVELFNNDKGRNLTSKMFTRLIVKALQVDNKQPIKTKQRVNGTPLYGLNGVTINTVASRTLK